jgi:hypothetical protein
VPTSTGASAAGNVRGRAAIIQIRTPLIVWGAYARRGNCAKSVGRFSRKALRPSWASSLM